MKRRTEQLPETMASVAARIIGIATTVMGGGSVLCPPAPVNKPEKTVFSTHDQEFLLQEKLRMSLWGAVQINNNKRIISRGFEVT